MASISYLKKQDGITQKLNSMCSRAKDVRAYLDTVVVQQYQKAQIKRWETENQSETGQWKELSSAYSQYKPRRFAKYPGAGKVLMIATGKLVDAATMRGSGYTKMVTNYGMTIAMDTGSIPYAKYVANLRPFMSFGDSTISQMRQGLTNYIRSGSTAWRAG